MNDGEPGGKHNYTSQPPQEDTIESLADWLANTGAAWGTRESWVRRINDYISGSCSHVERNEVFHCWDSTPRVSQFILRERAKLAQKYTPEIMEASKMAYRGYWCQTGAHDSIEETDAEWEDTVLEDPVMVRNFRNAAIAVLEWERARPRVILSRNNVPATLTPVECEAVVAELLEHGGGHGGPMEAIKRLVNNFQFLTQAAIKAEKERDAALAKLADATRERGILQRIIDGLKIRMLGL